ncbi:MAG: type II secretion system F family protein [Sporomusaceae bacterium]|nr:type II secretion system F family protein [Sporomusaceae bacterium]
MAVWIALAGGFISFLLLYVLVITRIAPKTQVKERVQKLRRAASPAEQARFESENLDASFSERIILPFFRRIEQYLIRLAPGRVYELMAERLVRAGKQHVWSVNAFVCFWLLCAASAMVVMTFFAFYVHRFMFIQGFALVLCALLLGAALPLIWLDSLIASRQKAIRRQLPEVLDLLCVSVQAGLSFDGAMARVTERMRGPLIDECGKMLRDVRMGMSRRLALANMADRCRLQEVYLFTAAVIQSDRLGVSIAKTLVVQADNMRERRRQFIKEQALKAPVKMLFPLALFIFPALFVVVLLPTIFSILNNMKAIGR